LYKPEKCSEICTDNGKDLGSKLDMDIILQIWGGLFYLTNKICFALAESKSKKQKRQLKLLVGSYLLAKNKASGWLFFMLINVSMGTFGNSGLKSSQNHRLITSNPNS